MSVYKYINPFINLLLRSPWHQLCSKRIMTVSYSGRRSGNRFNTPVSYYRNEDRVYCFTNGVWQHNFNPESAATLRIAGDNYRAIGKLYAGDQEQRINIMSAYFKAVPQDRKFYGAKCGAEGEPIRSQVEQALGSIVIIEFSLHQKLKI